MEEEARGEEANEATSAERRRLGSRDEWVEVEVACATVPG
jgi:hypothetical protein